MRALLSGAPDQWLGEDALYVTSASFYRRKDLISSYRTYFSSLEGSEQYRFDEAGWL